MIRQYLLQTNENATVAKFKNFDELNQALVLWFARHEAVRACITPRKLGSPRPVVPRSTVVLCGITVSGCSNRVSQVLRRVCLAEKP